MKSVAENKTDITVPGFVITEERHKLVDFSVPFFLKRNRKSGHHRDRPGNWKAAKYCNISVKEREQSFGPI